MVKGFDKFKQFFTPHSDSFIVIGGTAMQLHGRESGLVPRVTQDIDMLVIVEKMSESFTSAFHAFLREGRYDCYMAKEPFVQKTVEQDDLRPWGKVRPERFLVVCIRTIRFQYRAGRQEHLP